MKIKKNSWHYRWMVFCSDTVLDGMSLPKTLCEYFWCFWGVSLMMLLYYVTYPIGWYFGFRKGEYGDRELVKKRWFPWSLFLIPIVIVLGFIINPSDGGIELSFVLLALMGFGVIMFACIEVLPEYFNNKPESSFLTVTREFIRAKKRKVCPLIEYVDE